jgi:methyl-accepting chemotaxis protein-1 (serine sensor receptor)
MISTLSVKTKLILSFGVMTLIILLVCLLSLLNLSDANQRFSSYVDGLSKRKEIATDLLLSAQQRAISARNLVLVTSVTEQQSESDTVILAHKRVSSLLAELSTAIGHLSSIDNGSEEQRLLAVIENIESRYGPVALDIVRLATNGSKEAAIIKMNTECLPLLNQLVAAVNAYKAFGTKSAVASLERARAEYAGQRNVLIAVSGFAVMIALILSLLIIRGLARALGTEPAVLSTIAQRVASGDLRPISEVKTAAPGSVLFSLGEMQSSLSRLIGQVHSSSNVISTAAEELSTATEQSRIGVEHQRLEIDQVATAIHEMLATALEVARNSEDAANAALSADMQAQAGGGMAKQAITQIKRLADEVSKSATAMTRLKQESEHIGGVLDVIKSVADQTNLLALNAAIEAARAGDAGRGFAVVADEVRNLAKRTQGATQEIGMLTTGLQKIAEEAAGMMDFCRGLTDETVIHVSNTGNAVTAIAEMIANIQQMVRQIATAGEEQSAVAEEISRSVTSVRDIADQSAIASEQTAASSTSLANLGSALQQQIGRFQV